jgi:hypothetical protein
MASLQNISDVLEVVDFDSRQGRNRFDAAGVA